MRHGAAALCEARVVPRRRSSLDEAAFLFGGTSYGGDDERTTRVRAALRGEEPPAGRRRGGPLYLVGALRILHARRERSGSAFCDDAAPPERDRRPPSRARARFRRIRGPHGARAPHE